MAASLISSIYHDFGGGVAAPTIPLRFVTAAASSAALVGWRQHFA